jgi:hypothetical protein
MNYNHLGCFSRDVCSFCINYSAFGLKYTKLRFCFEIAILLGVAFGIPIANGGVHGIEA